MDQATILRRLTPSQRLQQTLSLSDFVRDIALLGIKKQFPRIKSRKKQMEILKKRWGCA